MNGGEYVKMSHRPSYLLSVGWASKMSATRDGVEYSSEWPEDLNAFRQSMRNAGLSVYQSEKKVVAKIFNHMGVGHRPVRAIAGKTSEHKYAFLITTDSYVIKIIVDNSHVTFETYYFSDLLNIRISSSGAMLSDIMIKTRSEEIRIGYINTASAFSFVSYVSKKIAESKNRDDMDFMFVRKLLMGR